MAAVLLRRSFATAGLTTLAVIAAPLAGTALAADPALTPGTFTPPNGATVQANRPAISVVYNTPLNTTSSTIAVTDTSASNAAVACSRTFSNSNKTIGCTLGADLTDAHSYKVAVHAVNGDSSNSRNDNATWTVDLPTLQSENPLPGGTIVDGTETLKAVFQDEISDTASTINLYERSGNVRGALLAGTHATSKSGGVLGVTDTVTFQPSGALTSSPGTYEAVLHVDGVDGTGADNPASHFDQILDFTVNTAPPGALVAPTFINNTNITAAPFSGTASPGTVVHVDVTGTAKSVLDSDTQTGLTTVAACNAAACPWAATVDVSALQDGTVTWTAQSFDQGNKFTTATPGPSTVIDTTAPSITSVTASAMAIGSHTLTVSATDNNDTDIAFYVVKVTDVGTAHTFTSPNVAEVSDDMPATAFDVSSLDDGDLTVKVTATDTHGNVSAVNATTTKTVTKDTGLLLDFPNGSVVANGATFSLDSADDHAIQPITQVTLKFTQPLIQSWTDNSQPPGTGGPTHSSKITIKTLAGNPVSSGSSTVPAGDSHALTTTIPGGLADGSYELTFIAWPKNFCRDLALNDSKDSHCVSTTADPVLNPANSQTYTFTVDGTPPAAPTVTMPSSINAAGVHSVGISGTAEPQSKVFLSLKSSGGGATLLGHGGQGIAVADDGTWQDVEDLTSLADGTLTVRAAARDVAGNVSPFGSPSPAPVLHAHRSSLSEHASASRVTYGHGVLVKGRLVDQSGAGIHAATISVKPRYDSGRFGPSVTATTDSTGRWQTTLFPAHNATFYASYAGSSSPVHGAASVHTARTLVRVAIHFTSPKSGQHSSPVTLKGKVSPNKHGVFVSIFRHRASGNTLLGRVKLSAASTWKFSLSFPKGKTRVFAKIGKTAGNLGKRTHLLTLTR
ncbi:MAG: large repetitive protein [Frankiaceae bacterium]|jgi:methionine-rich copper-binding protein CopC|nr:large repetitive protein [Frankiaceae bacterium]